MPLPQYPPYQGRNTSLPTWQSRQRGTSASRLKLIFRVLAVGAILYIINFAYHYRTPSAESRPSVHGEDAMVSRKALVVASLDGDDTSWLAEHFSDWERYIYVVDNHDANLTVPKNKGRESNAYLTFLIDHYHDLPDYMIFLHALRYQWHNEDPMYDGIPMIQKFRLPHLAQVGYANMRCTWVLGCPNEVKPRLDTTAAKDEDYSRVRVEAAYAQAFRKFFPGQPVPHEVGVHCGAQFALSRWKVLERPVEDYKEYRRWLWDTELDDSVSGRILEYMWHMLMGKPAVHCQHAGECFCQKYGLCNLTCTEDHCEKRFQLPQFATIPDGWPEVGAGVNGFPAKGWYDD